MPDPSGLLSPDERDRAINTRGSWLPARPGKTRGCVACPELHNTPYTGQPVAAHITPDVIEPPPWGVRSLSYVNDIQPIFTARCAVAGCHITPTQANLGLVLKDAATSYGHLVNVDSVEQPGVKRVVPGDSSISYLMAKLASGEMPQSGPMLSQGTRDTIRNWIDQGAPAN